MKQKIRAVMLLLASLPFLAGTGCSTYSQEEKESFGRTQVHTLKFGEINRSYYLHVPAKMDISRSIPLLLAFHGGGGTPAYIERESKFSLISDREGFLVAYPEGIRKSWNDGRKINAIPAQKENVDDINFIVAMIDEISKSYKVDEKRIFATGISNGGMFSYSMGIRLPEKFAAIAPVAGGIPEPLKDSFNPEHPVSAIIINGTDDPLVPYTGGEISIFRSKRGRILGAEESTRKFAENDRCTPTPVIVDIADKDPNDGCKVKKYSYGKGKDGTEVVLYRIEGGGHTWPDGRQYLPEMLIGKLCHDINASEIIWEFFKNHPKKTEGP